MFEWRVFRCEARMANLEIKRRMKNLLMFLPNMVVLCGRLLVDPAVPRTERVLFAGAIIYAIAPLDLIPDFLPFMGQVDDAYLIALTLLRLLDRTDAEVLRRHWRGGGDIVDLVRSMAVISSSLLPARVRRILAARVELSNPKAWTSGPVPRPLLVARTEEVTQGIDETD
jgi:uncharacterized membrane protein YkvA (DUF1232 family)